MVLRYLLPSVVDISETEKKTAQSISIRKDYNKKIMLTHLLPSVVVISGAGIKWTAVIN